jgi:outer membrane cobalamin receptor
MLKGLEAAPIASIKNNRAMSFNFSADKQKYQVAGVRVTRSAGLKTYPLYALWVAEALLSGYAVADSVPEVTLPSITVAFPRPSEDSAPEQSTNTTRLTQKDLSIAHERSVDEILRGLPGISISKAGAFGVGVVYARGAGGQGLITLDGMPIPDSVPGVVNLNALLPDGLEEITISRGFSPASRAFSSMGGSIRMTSRDALQSGADMRIEGGTYGFLQETLRGDWAGERGRIAVTVNRSDAFDGAYLADSKQGNSERDPFHGTQVMSKAGVALSENVDWESSLYFRGSSTGSDQYGVYNGAFAVVDQPNEFIRDEFWMAQNRFNAQLTTDWSSRLQVGYTHSRNRSHPNAVSLGYTADLYLARWENDHTLWQGRGEDSMHLLWGAEGRHESAVGVAGFDAFQIPAPAFSEERNQEAGFLDARFAYKDVSGDLGVRYEAYDRYKDQILLHAGAAWQILPDLRLRANGGNGFRIPSYNELLYPLRGNLALRPERGIGGDLGLEWRIIEPLTLSLTGFYNRFDDLISLSWNPLPSAAIPCMGLCMSNIAETSVAGFEAGSEWVVNAQWRGGAAYTYTDSRNLENDRRLPFRPRDSARLWGEWQAAAVPVSIWAELVYRGHAWNDVANNLPLDETLRFNARINYKVSPKLNVYVRGENLTGNRASEAYSFDYPGAMVFGGLELKL